MGKTHRKFDKYKQDSQQSNFVARSKYAEKQLKKTKEIVGGQSNISYNKINDMTKKDTNTIESTAIAPTVDTSFTKKDFEVAVYMIIELDSDGRFIDIPCSKLRRSDIEKELVKLEEAKKSDSLLQNKIYIIKRVRANKSKDN